MAHGELNIEIDPGAGFCFGVTTAINKAEEQLEASGALYCLGDIVHNSNEVERLESKGLTTITHEQLAQLRDVKVLLRAHGEPPATYATARRNHIEIIDATCPVVLQLQRRIAKSYATAAPDGRPPQIVIYGKRGHAEVNGLGGQTEGTALVIESADEIDNIDFTRDIVLYSQTTKSLDGFKAIVELIKQRLPEGVTFQSYDTICRRVAGRLPQIREFARQHQLILFVSGAKSSNGRILYDECRHANPNSRLISNAGDIDPAWLEGVSRIGITGATSTPSWLMNNVKSHLLQLTGNYD